MKDENLTLLSMDEMPVTDEKEEKPRVNCLQEMFIELLDERKLQLVDVQKGTEIPWGTIYAWYCGDVRAQLADRNLLKLAQFFNVSLEYLCFGIGEDFEAFEKFIDNDYKNLRDGSKPG
jgi:hypothetical protein